MGQSVQILARKSDAADDGCHLAHQDYGAAALHPIQNELDTQLRGSLFGRSRVPAAHAFKVNGLRREVGALGRLIRVVRALDPFLWPPALTYMSYEECCGRLRRKLAESGDRVGDEAMVLLDGCIDALRADSQDGTLDQAALAEHLPKLRHAIRTVWNHDRALAVRLENRIIQVLDEEHAKVAAAATPQDQPLEH